MSIPNKKDWVEGQYFEGILSDAFYVGEVLQNLHYRSGRGIDVDGPAYAPQVPSWF